MSVVGLEEWGWGGEVGSPEAFVADVVVPEGLEALAGHFPGRPILPGIVQISLVRRLICEAFGQEFGLASIPRARMSAAVLPGDELQVDIKKLEGWRFRVLIHKGEQLASRISVVLEPKA